MAEGIPVLERMEALALIHDGGRCHGAVVRNLVTGELSAYVAAATVHRHRRLRAHLGSSTNAVINEGMGAAIALETGVAAWATWRRCSSTPPPSFPAGILVTEGCRGDGGLLRDADGHRFMPDYEPEKKELASRDVVSRRMAEHMRKGKGRQVALRRAPVAGHHPAGRRPHRQEPARGEGDLPVLPRHRPGRKTDPGAPGPALLDGRHPHRPPRRVALAEGPVLLRRGGLLGHARLQPPGRQLGGRNRGGRHDRRRVHRRFLRIAHGRPQVSTGLVRDFLAREQAELAAMPPATASETRWPRCWRMQEIMTDKVGIFRTAPAGSRRRRTAAAAGAQPHIGLRTRRPAPTPSWSTAYRLQRMLKLALRGPGRAGSAPKAAAPTSARTSRRRDDADWLKRTLATWPDPDARPCRRSTTSRSTCAHGAAARLARLRREGRHRAPGTRPAPPRSPPSGQPSATPTVIPCAGTDALAPGPGTLPGPQRKAGRHTVNAPLSQHPHPGDRRCPTLPRDRGHEPAVPLKQVGEALPPHLARPLCATRAPATPAAY
jgi:fumarate reductase flavoprotein subunit